MCSAGLGSFKTHVSREVIPIDPTPSERTCLYPSVPDILHRLQFARPSVPRIHDCLLEGRDNFAEDRAAAAALLKQAPDLRLAVRDNRAFLTRAVEHLAARGFHAFLDLGCGLPANRNVYEIAARTNPRARVAYVDNDPMVAVHGRALLDVGEATTMIEADVRDLARIFADRHVASMLHGDEPVAVLAADLFPFVEETDSPAGIMKQLGEILPPRSVMVHSHLSSDGLDRFSVAAIEQVYAGTPSPGTLRSTEQIRGLFGGQWEITGPGVADVNRWLEEPTWRREPSRTATYVGGIVRVRS